MPQTYADNYSLPPGPPTIPILGNAHLLTGNGLEKKYVLFFMIEGKHSE